MENTPKLYQLTSSQYSARLSTDELTQLNNIAAQLQTDKNIFFTFQKDVIIHLMNEYSKVYAENTLLKTTISELKDVNAELTEALSNRPQSENIENNTADNSKTTVIKDRLIEEMGYLERPTDEQLYSDILEIITTPLAPAPTVEIEKPVIKEKELSENEVLIELTEKQKHILELIARYRYSLKEDTQRLSLSDLIKRMVFNRGTLLNMHGEFKTLLRPKTLKQ